MKFSQLNKFVFWEWNVIEWNSKVWINYEVDMHHENLNCGCVMRWTIFIIPMYRPMSENFLVFDQLCLLRNYKILTDKKFELFGANSNLHNIKADLRWYDIFIIESIFIMERQEWCFMREETNIILQWIYYGVNTQIALLEMIQIRYKLREMISKQSNIASDIS